MKIKKQTKEFRKLLEVIELGEKHVSETIIQTLQAQFGLEDKEDYYGLTIWDFAEDNDIEVEDILVTLLPNITDFEITRMLKYFGKLVIMGDRDCPECGGDTEECDAEYRTIPSFDYDCPPEDVPVWIEFFCPICGNTYKQEY